VFVMVLSAAVYFIPLICSYSDAITTGKSPTGRFFGPYPDQKTFCDLDRVLFITYMYI
jgi:hypothetical protein